MSYFLLQGIVRTFDRKENPSKVYKNTDYFFGKGNQYFFGVPMRQELKS